MRNVAVKPPKPKRKEAWDGISQDTPEQSVEDEEEEEDEEQLSETEIHAQDDEDGEKDMSMAGADEPQVATPRQTGEVERDQDDTGGEIAVSAILAAPNEETQDSFDMGVHNPSAPPAHQPSADLKSSVDSSSVSRPKRNPKATPLFGPDLRGSSQSESLGLDQVDSNRSGDGAISLTDIGALSSQAEQTQIDVEPTQVDYDAEHLPPSVFGDSEGDNELMFRLASEPFS